MPIFEMLVAYLHSLMYSMEAIRQNTVITTTMILRIVHVTATTISFGRDVIKLGSTCVLDSASEHCSAIFFLVASLKTSSCNREQFLDRDTGRHPGLGNGLPIITTIEMETYISLTTFITP